MAVKGNSSAKRQNSPSVAFGDFELVPVDLSMKKFISGKGRGQWNGKAQSKDAKGFQLKTAELSGGNGDIPDPIPSFYTKN